ncbi:MAG: S53 family peptidase [Terriglobia bacterium]
MWRFIRSVVGISFVLLPCVLAMQAPSAFPAQEAPNKRPEVISRVTKVKGLKLVSTSSLLPPTDAECRIDTGIPCYSPQEIRNAYGLTALLDAGYTGAGQTIIIIDSFGSPTIQQDLSTFDAGYGLPEPPSFTVLAPLGTVLFDPSNSEQVGWAFETTLDVEWAHALAPGAGIVLLTSPVSETEGVQGLPEFLQLEQYALDHHLGKIISQSWGATENTLFDRAGQQVMADFERFYLRAALENVTVLASSGDWGSANKDISYNYYSFPTVGFPASSPLVTAVGGTSLYADTEGNYQSETVWSSTGAWGAGASGGGVSQQFLEPLYQYLLPASVQRKLNHHRGIPDVAYNADPNTSILIYMSFVGTPGYYIVGGTSEGSPQWAGIIADADQLAGHPLGFLNQRLYLLRGIGFHDVTVGNNSFHGVPGYNATTGWDLATGWGSPDVSTLLRELVRLH